MTASAYSQARYKLKHTAFIELNQAAVVETLYGDEDYQRFWGFRGLAADGSKIVLPDAQGMREAFGTLAWTNGKTADIQGERLCPGLRVVRRTEPGRRMPHWARPRPTRLTWR